MKRFFKSIRLCALITVGVVGALVANEVQASAFDYLYRNLPFEMKLLDRPQFPDRSLSIKECGALGDGVTLNTQAFASAMQQLSAQGGGRLIVPKGVWLTGPITFLSNVNMVLEDESILVFSSNFDHYPLVNTSFEGLETKRCLAPLNASGATNIAITGSGTIDGSGDAWRFVKKGKMTDGQWKNLITSGVLNTKKDTWYPTAGSLKGAMLTEGNFNVPNVSSDREWDEIKAWLRPVLLSFSRCKGVYLQGVTFQNSPSWNLHPNMCEDVILEGVTVRNPWYAQNGDGLDLESCTNAIIVDSNFDVGDDAICIKSGKNEDGRRRAMPCQNVIVENCKVFHGHGGFVVGSEMSGGAKNIMVRNCQFLGTDVGLRFKSTRGRGGVVENIFIENINMINIPTEALLFDLYYGGKSSSEELEEGTDQVVEQKSVPVTEETPAFRNIFISNVTCRGARRAMFFNGLPEMPIQNIVVENTSIYSTLGAELSEVDGVQLRNVKIVAEKSAPLTINNGRNMQVDGFSHNTKTGKTLVMKGSKCARVIISMSDFMPINTSMIGVSAKAITFK